MSGANASPIGRSHKLTTYSRIAGFCDFYMSKSTSMKKLASLALLPPLTFSTPDGKPYVRPEAVDAEIQRMLQRPMPDWIPAATGLKSESLVFLIRYIREKDQGISGRFLEELGKRTVRMADRWVHGVYPAAREYIVLQVEIEITQLVLIDTPSRQSEFLEIAFGRAVARRTTNAVRDFRRSPMGRQGNGPLVVGEEAEEIERPIETIPDDSPSSEEICELRLLVAKGLTFVTDGRHLEAVILRYLEGWPMTANDADAPCLVRHFQVSARQIQNWINIALDEIKKGISGNSHGRTKFRI